MSNFEVNKIFAALLCAGITIWVGGIIANKIIHPRALETDAVAIDGASGDAHGGGQAAEPMVEPIMALIAAADVEKGAKLSKACAACHAFEKGGPNKQGPGLWGVVGHQKAAHEGFEYSAGMKEKGGSWDYDSLNHFLWKPKKYISDTKMNFIGLKKPEDRAALIAWLRQQSDSPAALPTDADIAAEAAALAPPEAEEAHGEEAAHGDEAAEATVEESATPAAEATPEEATEESPAEH